MKTGEFSLKKYRKKKKKRSVKSQLNSVKKKLIGTWVKISVKGRLQNLPGCKMRKTFW